MIDIEMRVILFYLFIYFEMRVILKQVFSHIKVCLFPLRA